MYWFWSTKSRKTVKVYHWLKTSRIFKDWKICLEDLTSWVWSISMMNQLISKSNNFKMQEKSSTQCKSLNNCQSNLKPMSKERYNFNNSACRSRIGIRCEWRLRKFWGCFRIILKYNPFTKTSKSDSINSC